MTESTASDIGARLRTAREQSGLSLRQIAEATKLSTRALDSLERGRVSQLPGGIYRRAIVRSYATEIGLDPEETLRAFLSQHPDDLPAPPVKTVRTDSWGNELPAPVAPPAPRRNVWQTMLSVLGALIPITAGILYFAITTRGADASRVAVDTSPAAVEVWHPQVVSAADFSDAPAVTSRPISLMISVTAPCQLQVIADGREVVKRQLRAGEQLQVELARDVVLFGDDAGAIHFSINGRAGRQLGKAGAPLDVRIERNDYEDWLVRP